MKRITSALNARKRDAGRLLCILKERNRTMTYLKLTPFAALALAFTMPLHAAVVLNPTDDTWVNIDSKDTNYGSNTTVSVRNNTVGATKDKERFAIFEFSLASLPDSFTDAVFAVTNTNSSTDLYEFSLYGINDGADDEDFDESTVTFNTFAHASSSSTDGLDTTNLTLLASDVQSTVDLYTFDTTALLDFVNNDTNDVVSFVLFSTYSTGGSAADFASSEATSGQPTLTLVPEPGSLALLGLGGLMMLGRRKR